MRMQPTALLPTPFLPPALGIEPDCYGTLPMDGLHLSRLLDEAAARRPDHTAVLDEHGRTLSFAALLHGADRLATRLARWGAGRGDRVGLWLPKSLQTVTAIHGILRSGAAYVPVDPTGPALRAASIFAAAGVKAVVVDSSLAAALSDAWRGPGPLPRLILVVMKETEKPHARSPQPDGTPPAGSAVGECALDRDHGRRRAVAPGSPPRS